MQRAEALEETPQSGLLRLLQLRHRGEPPRARQRADGRRDDCGTRPRTAVRETAAGAHGSVRRRPRTGPRRKQSVLPVHTERRKRQGVAAEVRDRARVQAHAAGAALPGAGKGVEKARRGEHTGSSRGSQTQRKIPAHPVPLRSRGQDSAGFRERGEETRCRSRVAHVR